MRGDYSRIRFDPLKDVSGVLQQQGRVQLDADWNEYIEAINRRQRTTAIDVMNGRCVVPRFTEEGFKLAVDGTGALTIGPGRLYADGLLAENHGRFSAQDEDNYDAVLDELRGPDPVPYLEQPYPGFRTGFVAQYGEGPDAVTGVALPVEGRHLAYLDVWQREVTHLHDPTLVEPAVGVDTTNRLQTVWRVRFLPAAEVLDPTSNASQCEQADANLLARQFAGGRLTTDTVDVEAADDPCEIPPGSAYKGLENQLFRVEIHEGRTLDTATFKWSRDNASTGTSITKIDGQTLTVARTQWDALRGFKNGDWIEITDDWREFAGLPGLMRQIAVDGVDDDARTIKLTGDSIGGVFAGDSVALKARHTRICRWDSEGAMPIPDADGGGKRTLNLGLGIQIEFSTTPGGEFRQGDYWTFAARTGDLADGSIEKLDAAPPRGVHHHYCPLSFVNFVGGTTVELPDCRALWPPEPTEGCLCTVCVTEASHASGQLTIQMAIGMVKQKGGGTVCLEAGNYLLTESLRIESDPDLDIVATNADPAQSIRLVGQGFKTVLVYTDALRANAGGEELNRGAINIRNAIGVKIERMSIITVNRACITAIGCVGLIIQECSCYQVKPGHERFPAAIGLGGVLVNCFIRENVVVDAVHGIEALRHVTDDANFRMLLTSNLYIEDNLIFCQELGIWLDGIVTFLGEARISGNTISCDEVGIVANGISLPSLEVARNKIATQVDGIHVGGNDLRVRDNDIFSVGRVANGNGIVLLPSSLFWNAVPVEQVDIAGNHIKGLAGNGILFVSAFGSAMIKNNVIENVGMEGIAMASDSSAKIVSIENNHLTDVVRAANNLRTNVSAIRIQSVAQAEIASNTIKGVGESFRQTPIIGQGAVGGILALATASVRIAGNDIADVGPKGQVGRQGPVLFGIGIGNAVDRVDVTDNVVRQSTSPTPQGADGYWIGLAITTGFQQLDATDLSSGPINPNVQPTSPGLPVIGALVRRVVNGLIAVFENRIVAFPEGQEVVAVRGNLLDGSGASRARAVRVGAGGAVALNDNRCLITAGTPQAVAQISAGGLVANANYFEAPQLSTSTIGLFVAVGQVGPFTILGNISNRTIRVNSVPLGIPWNQLNVTG